MKIIPTCPAKATKSKITNALRSPKKCNSIPQKIECAANVCSAFDTHIAKAASGAGIAQRASIIWEMATRGVLTGTNVIRLNPMCQSDSHRPSFLMAL
ncbi:hypothetical protein CDAR_196351 [Caerostris darwini]|uniref:Uncharacterized protein n=1 Tax=Caerostris darwini TaxID=1538125 RepID=A0AAV4PWI1_9ARAC|nr:hypothetical protein CDAR_196351 [Caerostris darwini]